jgi:hypothetical protein
MKWNGRKTSVGGIKAGQSVIIENSSGTFAEREVDLMAYGWLAVTIFSFRSIA